MGGMVVLDTEEGVSHRNIAYEILLWEGGILADDLTRVFNLE